MRQSQTNLGELGLIAMPFGFVQQYLHQELLNVFRPNICPLGLGPAVIRETAITDCGDMVGPVAGPQRRPEAAAKVRGGSPDRQDATVIS